VKILRRIKNFILLRKEFDTKEELLEYLKNIKGKHKVKE